MFSVLLGMYIGAAFLGHRVTLFKYLRDCQTVFHACCTILHPCQQCLWIPISLYPCQHLLLCIVILVGLKWYLIEVLICIFLVSDDEHFFSDFWPCISSLVKCRFKSFAHLYIGFFIFLVLCCKHY